MLSTPSKAKICENEGCKKIIPPFVIRNGLKRINNAKYCSPACAHEIKNRQDRLRKKEKDAEKKIARYIKKNGGSVAFLLALEKAVGKDAKEMRAHMQLQLMAKEMINRVLPPMNQTEISTKAPSDVIHYKSPYPTDSCFSEIQKNEIKIIIREELSNIVTEHLMEKTKSNQKSKKS